ncbi:MAG: hypothetical protein KAU01_05420, partial [Candidatus Cloacimonetes bacterium]|nr:hypothetical protein [Candidatus Cloacimonadota bacterium]
MRLKIGIVGFHPGWEILLNQIGVSFEIISFKTIPEPDIFSVIIIPEKLNINQKEPILQYLRSGGSVLFYSKTYADICGFNTKTKKVSYLLSEENSIFSNVGLVDVNSKIEIIKSKDLQVLDVGLKIYHQQIGNGFLLVIPFDINTLILDSKSVRKKFYSERKELPSEIVARVSKCKIREIIKVSLEYLHQQRGLPFVHKWYYPRDWESMFIFRLDTDFCSSEDADSMYKVCKDNNIRATWFLDTGSEDRLQNYSKMQDQEMALHCEKHLVFDDCERNSNNLKTALSKLEKASIDPKGFAAPFGDWNPALAQVLEDLAFEYSSEFTLDYDNLPFYPFFKGRFTEVLQIPIHPISLGRLRRSHFSKEEMINYYKKLIEEKIELNKPIIIYHHPHHHHFEVFNKVFEVVNGKEINNITMLEYVQWWKKRSQMQLDLNFEKNEIISSNSE